MPAKVRAEVAGYSSTLSAIRLELDSLKRDWKFKKELLEADKKFIMDWLELFTRHVEEEHGADKDLKGELPFPKVILESSLPPAKSAESLPEIDWGFLKIDTSAHEAELENALRERMSADEWAEREAAKIEETRWNEYFENAAPEAERALFSESVERRFAAFMETYAAIEKANRSDDLGDAFENDPEIETAFAMSKKQMLEIIRADVAAQIRRQNGLIEKDGQVISDPDQAIGDVRLRTDYFVEMQKRQTMKHLEESLANESKAAE